MAKYIKLEGADLAEHEELLGMPLTTHRRPVSRWACVTVGIAVASFITGMGVGTGVLSRLPKAHVGVSWHKESSGLIPDFKQVTKTFKPDHRYWGLDDDEALQRWTDLVHHGHIVVENPKSFGIGEGIPVAPNTDRMMISGFHRIHCLKTIRESFYTMLTDHCFDYLRQSLQCNMDFTLEHARVDEDGYRRYTDGWGTRHQCIDYDAAKKWADAEWEREMATPGWELRYDSPPKAVALPDALPHCTFPHKI